jgi:hypothetical protein
MRHLGYHKFGYKIIQFILKATLGKALAKAVFGMEQRIIYLEQQNQFLADMNNEMKTAMRWMLKLSPSDTSPTDASPQP